MATAISPKHWHSWRLRTKLLIVGTMLLLAWSIFQLWPVWVVPGPKTTVITGPLRADGSVDYSAALNQAYSKGVTPENNAVVLLLQGLGPAVIDKWSRPAYFQELGVDPPSLDGPYFQQIPYTNQETIKRLLSERDEAMRLPWGKDDHPEIAAWLASNEIPLSVCAAAVRREKFFNPIITPPGSSMLMVVFPPLQQEFRELARTYQTRVTFHLHTGNVEAALDDAETIHRLSRHIDHFPTLTSRLTAQAISSVAFAADGKIINSGILTSQQAHRRREMIAGFPPWTDLAELYDHGERFQTLDAAQMELMQWSVPSWIHPNAFLETFNLGYDELVAALKQPTHQEQQDAIAILQLRLTGRTKSVRQRLGDIILRPRRLFPERLANSLMKLTVDSAGQLRSVEQRAQIQTQLGLLGFALAEYRAIHHQFPPSLDNLVPEFLPEIPRDPYADGPMKYLVNQETGTMLVYSVGENGVDDHGLNDSAINADDQSFGDVPKTPAE